MIVHEPVLLNEVIEQFQPQAGDWLLDCTLGHGGHSAAYLDSAPGTQVVGLDADATALAAAKSKLALYGDRVHYKEGTFAQLQDLVLAHSMGSGQGGEVLNSPGQPTGFSHVLFDLGIGSHQLADQTRGFSFASRGPLLMRYAGANQVQPAQQLPPAELASLNMLEARLGQPPEALDIIRQLSREELAEVLRHYGEEHRARPIAEAIKREARHIDTGHDVAAVIEELAPRRGKIHPATKTFQALRLAVNRELETLAVALPQAVAVLKPEGRLAVISFHSLEDRLTKQFFRREPRLTVLTKKPIVATRAEVSQNSRARSAKLRVAIKIE